MFENIKFNFYPSDILKWLKICIFDLINPKLICIKHHGKPDNFNNTGYCFDWCLCQQLGIELK